MSEIASLKEDLDAFDAEIQNVDNKVDANKIAVDGQIYGLSTGLEEAEVKIEANSKAVLLNTDSLSEIKDNGEKNEQNIAAVADSIHSISDQVAAMNKMMNHLADMNNFSSLFEPGCTRWPKVMFSTLTRHLFNRFPI